MADRRKKSKEQAGRVTKSKTTGNKGKRRRSTSLSSATTPAAAAAVGSSSITKAKQESQHVLQQQHRQTTENSRRRTTLYDAVAGRLTQHGFRALASTVAIGQRGGSSNVRPVDPFRALFNVNLGVVTPVIPADGAAAAATADGDGAGHVRDAQQQAMMMMNDQVLMEKYTYDAWTRNLPTDEPHAAAAASGGGGGVTCTAQALELPEGQLLEAIHAYTSDYYDAMPDASVQRLMQHNMEGSALFALGVLLEEVAREQLGADGDLALLEGEQADLAGSSSSAAGAGAGARRLWYNGVRTVPFVTEEEVDVTKQGRPDYEVVEGSLLKILLS